jgi:hypothetical protein
MHQTWLNAMSVWVNNIGHTLTGSAPPRAYVPTSHARLTGTQSIPDSTDTIVSFGAAGINNDGMWVSGNPDHFTIQTDGLYYVTGQVHFDLNSTGSRAAHILLNGTSVYNSIAAFTQNAVGSGEGSAIPIVMSPIKFVAGTTLYLQVWQNSGGALNVTTTLSGTFLSVVRVGDSIGGLVL